MSKEIKKVIKDSSKIFIQYKLYNINEIITDFEKYNIKKYSYILEAENNELI